MGPCQSQAGRIGAGPPSGVATPSVRAAGEIGGDGASGARDGDRVAVALDRPTAARVGASMAQRGPPHRSRPPHPLADDVVAQGGQEVRRAGRRSRRPVPRSTACTITSRARIHGVSDAGTVRPCAVTTSASHCSSGQARPSPSSSVAAGAVEPLEQLGRRPLRLPASMSALRCSGEEYIGVGSPGGRPVHEVADGVGVGGQVGDARACASSRAARSAAVNASSSSPARAPLHQGRCPRCHPAAGVGERAGHQRRPPRRGSHRRPMPSISVTTSSPPVR